MKIAQCKYNHSGTQISVDIYFDSKAFELLRPTLDKQEEEKFLRLVCDSLAASMPKENIEKQFFIKRILRDSQNNTLMLLCTDGFLVDSALTIPITQQAFSQERVHITETEQLPSRFRLSAEILKNIQDKLASFEEKAESLAPAAKITATKETPKQEKIVLTTREYPQDKMTDILLAINHAKKEVREIALSNNKMLENLMGKISAQSTDSHLEEANKTLKQKIQDIHSIPEKFEADITSIMQGITQQTDRLATFKEYVLSALYESAKQVSEIIAAKMPTASAFEKKTLVTEFNRKFSSIAILSEAGKLTGFADTQAALGKLSLDSIQEIISNDDKTHPGLLQKCNTSWTEESLELQIVIKHLTRLNKQLSSLFDNNPAFAQYANKEMTQIIRIPFPRSFQFKFTDYAYQYKKSVDDFCREQKDIIVNLAKQCKQRMQVDDVGDKTLPMAVDTQTKLPAFNQPVADFKELLIRKEASGKLVAAAIKEQELTQKYLHETLQVQEEMKQKIDPYLEIITKKIAAQVNEIQSKVETIKKLMGHITDIKSRIDTAIDHAISHPNEAMPLELLDKNIKALEANKQSLANTNTSIQALRAKFSYFDSAIALSKKISQSPIKEHMRTLRNEAKQLLLQLFTNQDRNIHSTEKLKNQMIALYSEIDASILDIEKMNTDLSQFKDQLLTELNDSEEDSVEDIEKKLTPIMERLGSINSAQTVIEDKIAHLKKLSLDIGK
jgi:hypothetical protein